MKLRKFLCTISRRERPLAAVAEVLTVLAVICGITFAWYHKTQNVEGTYASIKSDSELVALSEFTIYYSDGATVTESNNDCVITLKSFDSVFGRNQDTPIYILIPVSGEAVQNTGYELSLTFDCNNDSLLDSKGEKILPYFSNVAQVRCVTVTAPPDTYEQAQNHFSGNEAECFASFTVDKASHQVQTSSKNSTVAFALDEHSATGEIYVLFELGYNFKLISGFVDNNSNNFTGRLDTTQSLEFNDKDHTETYLISVSAKEKAGA